MNQKVFNTIVDKRLEKCKKILNTKKSIYASDADRLKNFYDGASLNECTPNQYAFMLATKHIVALKDYIVEDKKISKDFIDEKITDIINYILIIEALLEDKR